MLTSRMLMFAIVGACAAPSPQRWACSNTDACDGAQDAIAFTVCATPEQIEKRESDFQAVCEGLLGLTCGDWSCDASCSPTGSACESDSP